VFRGRFLSVFVTAFLLTTAAAVSAHDIPTDVTIQAFLKPQGGELQLLVRVPLEAMRDMPVPTRPDGTLDLPRFVPLIGDAAMLWIAQNVELFENDRRLPPARLIASRLSVQSDRSFEGYDRAVQHVTGPPLPGDAKMYWAGSLVDALFSYPIQSDRSAFSIRPKLARLGVHTLTVLRFVTLDGAVRPFEYIGDPGLVRLDPSWYQAAGRFVELGFFHILDGTDHLLFLFCLVIPFRRLRALIPVITAFTVAHSITLIASAYNLAPGALWFPPLIETLIAMSIVYMALENIVAARLERRWLITLGFGLVHGFGFSFALRQTMQFAGTHLLTSLLSFNLGVELGQLLVLALLIPALELLFRFVVAERMGTIILSTLVAHTAWHWMLDRSDRLRQYTFEWPAMDAVFLLSATRWLLIAVAIAAVAWLASGPLRGRARQTEREART
jgi:HupE / UreJ protein